MTYWWKILGRVAGGYLASLALASLAGSLWFGRMPGQAVLQAFPGLTWLVFFLSIGPFLLCAAVAERYAIRWWGYYVAFAVLGLNPFPWAIVRDPFRVLLIPVVGALVYWAVSGRHAGREREERERLARMPPTPPGH